MKKTKTVFEKGHDMTTFEEWAIEQEFDICKDSHDQYTNRHTADAQWAFIAGRDFALEAAAQVVQALKYYERGEGLMDDDPHSDNHPDYERYMIDERLQDAADAIRALKKGE